MGERRKCSAGCAGRGEYALVRRAAPLLAGRRAGSQPPDLDSLAAELGIGVEDVQWALERWSGVPLADFALAWTADYVRSRLVETADVLAAGTTRVHDFDVRVAATITADAGRRGEGLSIAYGFHESPFGTALVLATAEGVCGLAFVDDEASGDRQLALDDMVGRWPRASFREVPAMAASMAERIFGGQRDTARAEVPLVLIGTPFDLSVWQALLRIPTGQIVSYTDIARYLRRPDAARAVGTANGRNPISFVVPCHRALRGNGALGGYYWGLDRKRAMIAREAGHARRIKP